MRGLRVLLVLVLLCGACACTSVVTPPAPTTVAPTTAPDAIVLPPRPRDIPIDEVDPCSLLTPAQREALDLEGEPNPSTSTTSLLGFSRNCLHLGFGTPNIALSIALTAQAGVERYTSTETQNRLRPVDIAGFPAVLARPAPGYQFCTVALDIAPGQLIDVQFSDGGANDAPIPMDDLCTGAHRAAVDVMQTLLVG